MQASEYLFCLRGSPIARQKLPGEGEDAYPDVAPAVMLKVPHAPAHVFTLKKKRSFSEARRPKKEILDTVCRLVHPGARTPSDRIISLRVPHQTTSGSPFPMDIPGSWSFNRLLTGDFRLGLPPRLLYYHLHYLLISALS